MESFSQPHRLGWSLVPSTQVRQSTTACHSSCKKPNTLFRTPQDLTSPPPHTHIKIKQKAHRWTGEIYSSVFPELHNTVIVLKLGGNFKYWALLKIWAKHSLPVQSLCNLQDLDLTCNQDMISPAIRLF